MDIPQAVFIIVAQTGAAGRMDTRQRIGQMCAGRYILDDEANAGEDVGKTDAENDVGIEEDWNVEERNTYGKRNVAGRHVCERRCDAGAGHGQAGCEAAGNL